MSYLSWKSCKNVQSRPKYVTFRKSNGIDVELFKTDLRAQNWNDVEACDNIDIAVNRQEELLLEVVNNHIKKTAEY